MSSARWRSFFPGLNVLIFIFHCTHSTYRGHSHQLCTALPNYQIWCWISNGKDLFQNRIAFINKMWSFLYIYQLQKTKQHKKIINDIKQDAIWRNCLGAPAMLRVDFIYSSLWNKKNEVIIVVFGCDWMRVPNDIEELIHWTISSILWIM